MNWYVVYTKPKWEKKVAEQLAKIGVECYCPLITQIRQWTDRKKKVEVPLFNSYVFVQLEPAQRSSVFECSGAIRYLFWLGQPAIVRDEEISVIKKWLNAPESGECMIETYKIGDAIQLESGPFCDQKAIVQEVNNTHYVLVLESLGCVLKMKIK
ncbi:transcriptional antiterminator RfaH [Flavobacterium sp. PL11]|jgi:transcriptional antiterminator RfaH|uniref:UpxY family transcription antiterminator n=1 Tax=Flavobacterium sp. PL11 TaxID=3071717 RepID=UPI002DFDC3CA|nr:transcriptional antiterminator RfaH [Flavobacterium sp. PL11]